MVQALEELSSDYAEHWIAEGRSRSDVECVLGEWKSQQLVIIDAKLIDEVLAALTGSADGVLQ